MGDRAVAKSLNIQNTKEEREREMGAQVTYHTNVDAKTRSPYLLSGKL